MILEQLQTACPQKKLVFGEGPCPAEICLIGEAPGATEELEGRPFVGQAGKTLWRFLETVGLKREDLYLTNVVKFRPTRQNAKTGRLSNRPPSQEEVDFFRPFLLTELVLVRPKLIVTLGNVPLRAVLDDKKALVGDCHGQLLSALGTTVFALYHPAAVIYNPKLKETYEADLQRLKGVLHI